MADLVNPYANPYLPSFVNQRPRINDPAAQPFQAVQYTQIHSVKGFEGARAYNLAPGSSEILAESDPNTARVYIVACDSNGQKFVEGYRLIKEEEPKPITMEDLNSKMSELLDRMNKLETEKVNNYGQPNYKSSKSSQWKPGITATYTNSRDIQSVEKSSSNDADDVTE